jgi:hypothetical protein
MTSRIDQFKTLLRKDENLANDLTPDQIHHVATLLAFSGCRPPLPVWTTREEVDAAPPGVLVETPAGTIYEKRAFSGRWWETGCQEDWFSYQVELPVQVRWLP